MRAVFTGGVYTDPDTTPTMLTTVDSVKMSAGGEASGMPPGMYRMGVWVTEVEGYTVYRHSGFWGTIADYVPELDLAIAATVNQNQEKTVLWNMMGRAIVAIGDATNPPQVY